jgi:hypothetical protein
MKTLNFSEENKEAYAMLYEAVRARPVQGIEQIIKAATIIEKFKELGEETNERTGIFSAFKLKTIPSSLELEDDHFKYVKNAFNETPWSTSVKIELLAQIAKLLKSVEDEGLKLV